MSRQATGPNEHPSTPTFLQVYKMLSMYSLLKPPKSGNCKILEPTVHTITITDLNLVDNKKQVSQRAEKIENLRKKLDNLIMTNVEVDDIIFEHNIHNYNKAKAEDCVIYYICGYITKNLIKTVKCDTCLTVLIGMYSKLVNKPTFMLK